MERLTTRDLLDCVTLRSVFDVQTIDYWDENGDAKSAKAGLAINRLAAYEDTGLEPEEITANYQMLANIAGAIKSIGIDRLVELAEADKDGRCVVLPCKVETLMERYNVLKFPTGDEAENYSTGYRNGHKNGQAELLEYLLGIDTGERSEAAEAALKAGDTH